ncbi:methylthioadenosine phosphorylase [Azonexus fungiphilus]|uniref:Probable 6-oxopurine nucleoside phosphorylase n=1 Tax=Azonexus fungiphilus TaxID=146940 RepID=A0A495VQU2_9RHOO|nr:S-methyl-5'-thioinosine phosphorylase [Azonexus fungiphilus]NHC07765.1 S-methyl-5'-thioinosine phosphorylase [Azonexus fungiphilus]RKT50803.1 methylthioadenosine phosphorylase [Azonexus fungiphilus]
MLAIIGGSGLTTLSNLDVSHREVVRTPFGEPSGALVFGQICGRPAVFLPRHGYGHSIPPHMVNYRANLWALHHHEVTGIISVASVGGIRDDLQPGDIVLPDQIIDYTWGRKSTFFDGVGSPVTHVDFTEPYDAALTDRIADAATALSIPFKRGAVYAATQGPRLETAAEINRFERDGADIVGMTGMPEAVLARELGVPYAAISVIANHAAGRGSSAHGIRFESLDYVLQEAMGRVRSIIERVVGCQDNCQPMGISV